LNQTLNRIELPEDERLDERKTDEDFPTKICLHLRSTTRSTRHDLFRLRLATIFLISDSGHSIQAHAVCQVRSRLQTVDVSALTVLLGKMSVTTSEAGLEA
jgi:hypothetical protein